MISQHVKKFIRWASILSLISLFSVSTVYAQDEASGGGGSTSESGGSSAGDAALEDIAANTGNILHLLQNLNALALQWISPDTSQTTATMQANFAAFGSLINQNLQSQSALQTELENAIIPPEAAEGQGGPPPVNSAEYLYSTILAASAAPSTSGGSGKSKPGESADPPPLAYIKNASGINLTSTIPSAGWQGSKADQDRYGNYIKTILAVKSFNAYVLGSQYVDGNQLNIAQNALVTQAADSKTWFAQVASESIGTVLRQILIYESQIYVVLTQILQYQKQMASLQAMTNTMLIANGQDSESLMAERAQNNEPTAPQ